MATTTKEVAMGGQAGAPGANTGTFQRTNAMLTLSSKVVNALLAVIFLYIGAGVFLYGIMIFGYDLPILYNLFNPIFTVYEIPLSWVLSVFMDFDDDMFFLVFFFYWFGSILLLILLASRISPFTSAVFSRATKAMLPASYYFESGEAMVQAGNYPGAIAEFNVAMRKNPGYPNVYYNLGFASMKMLQYENAAGYFQEELKKNSAHFYSRLYAGYCYLKLGRANDAIRELLDAVRANPDSGDAHAWLGNAYHLAGKYNDALQEYQKVKNIAPDHENLDLNIGEVYFDMGAWDNAIAALKLATNRSSGNELAHYKLGLVYSKKGMYDDAIAEFNAAIRINPQNAEYKDMLELTRSSQKSVAASIPQKEILKEKEIIKEIVKVPCEYCQTLVDVTSAKCPSCGAPLRGK